MGRGRPRVMATVEDLTQRASAANSFAAATFAPAPTGPVGELVRVSSYGEFKKIFGKPVNKVQTPGHYQVLSWFRNEGGTLLFQRIAELNTASAVAASLDVSGADDGILKLVAKATGPAGNQISIRIYALTEEKTLAVGVDGKRVSVRLATNAEGDITSTVGEVLTALEAVPEVVALVNMAVENGTDLAAVCATTYLVGGKAGGDYTDGTSKVILPIRTRSDSVKVLDAIVSETLDFSTLSVESPDNKTNYDAVRTRNPSAGALEIRILPVLEGLSYSPSEIVIEVMSPSLELLERLQVSTFKGFVDGDGLSKYIGDVLENSKYLEFILQPGQQAVEMPSVLAHSEPEFVSGNLIIGEDYFDGWKSLVYVADVTASQDAIDELSKSHHDYWVVFNSVDTKAALLQTQGVTFTKQRCVAALGSYQDSAETYINRVTGSGESDFGLINAKGERSVFVAGLYEVYDGDNDKFVKVHGAGALAALICRAWANQGIHYSPSGVRRGGIAGGVPLQFTDAEKDALYDARINYLETSREYGPVLVGQKTLVNRDCALDHLNVSAVVMYCNDVLARMLQLYVEETNDERTRMLARINGEQFLAGMKASGALYDFFVVCDRSNNTDSVIDANEMVFDYYMKPSRSIDYIPLRGVIAPTGVSFDSLK